MNNKNKQFSDTACQSQKKEVTALWDSLRVLKYDMFS